MFSALRLSYAACAVQGICLVEFMTAIDMGMGSLLLGRGELGA